MLNPNFKNGRSLDLHNAFALFVVAMGCLFYIESAPGTQTAMTLFTILFGFGWFLGHKNYLEWRRTHPHQDPHHH
jgi:hypothetical protein